MRGEPNDGAFHSYTFKVFPPGAGVGLLSQVTTGTDGKPGCLRKPLLFRGGAYRIEYDNITSYENDKDVVNSRITKLVIQNAGKKAVTVTPPAKQGESVKTPISIPVNQTTTLTYTATVLKPVFKR